VLELYERLAVRHLDDRGMPVSRIPVTLSVHATDRSNIEGAA
jgi:hypothetical protein